MSAAARKRKRETPKAYAKRAEVVDTLWNHYVNHAEENGTEHFEDTEHFIVHALKNIDKRIAKVPDAQNRIFAFRCARKSLFPTATCMSSYLQKINGLHRRKNTFGAFLTANFEIGPEGEFCRGLVRNLYRSDEAARFWTETFNLEMPKVDALDEALRTLHWRIQNETYALVERGAAPAATAPTATTTTAAATTTTSTTPSTAV